MVTDVYQYDPYGRMELGGEGHTDFYGYRAESYNPNTGLEYLRARYYNADKGRFFQEDTYLGDITEPLTLNRYAYVKNSPLNYADPSGHVNIPGAIAGALLGGVGGAAESFILQMIFTQDVAPNELAGDAVAGAVVGGLEGAFSGKVPRWLKSFAQSKVPDGIMTAATYVVSSLVSGEKIEKFDLAAQFIAGMVGGTLLEKIGGNVDSVKYAKDIIESISVLRKPVYNQTWKSGIDYYLTQLVRATVDWLNSGLKYIGISVTLEEVLNIFDGFKTDLIKLMDQALGLIQSELCNFIKDFRHEMQKN
ncbi:MAG: RHS repeat-associated core domain-containing protein [Clostridium sp.]|nr:RHS repeat-associated core domain-containing protein [Clostridium sp.]